MKNILKNKAIVLNEHTFVCVNIPNDIEKEMKIIDKLWIIIIQ